jgi:hypothetical protein
MKEVTSKWKPIAAVMRSKKRNVLHLLERGRMSVTSAVMTCVSQREEEGKKESKSLASGQSSIQ